jgi:hypothetical protein
MTLEDTEARTLGIQERGRPENEAIEWRNRECWECQRENDASREGMVRARIMSTNPLAMVLVIILHGDNSQEKAIFRSIESETTVRQNIGRTFCCLARKVMVKILQQCFWRRQYAREDYVDLREGRKEQLVKDDGGVDSRRYRARLQSERILEKHSNFWWLATEVIVKINFQPQQKHSTMAEDPLDDRGTTLLTDDWDLATPQRLESMEKLDPWDWKLGVSFKGIISRWTSGVTRLIWLLTYDWDRGRGYRLPRQG